ncbi:MAG: transcription termination factor Rho [Bifidobacterium pseudocatenulatum]
MRLRSAVAAVMRTLPPICWPNWDWTMLRRSRMIVVAIVRMMRPTLSRAVAVVRWKGRRMRTLCAILMTFSPRCLRRAVMMTNVVTRLKTVISRVVVAVASAIGVTAWIVVAVACVAVTAIMTSVTSVVAVPATVTMIATSVTIASSATSARIAMLNANSVTRSRKEDLVPVAGIVDVLDSYAFVRTSGYLPGPNDVYVSMGQVKKYGLRKGDAVHGSIRTPREGDRRNQRQKFVPLQSIDSINGMTVEAAQNRPQFNKLTPLYPQERLKQETAPNKLTGRLIDIVAPIGKGQRGLIVSPPKAGKTITLQNIANAIATNNPEVHLMVVLVDERPEEVTDMERTVQGEVISSTFDRPASDHTTVAELAIERAKRLVELGQDVVVLLDSMTRLARAYNIAAPASGRILSGGVDAQALYPPKKFFGAARNIENGGSLTIISSALVETGSKMDEVIFEESHGHRQHGAAPEPRTGRQAPVPGHRRERFRHPSRGTHHRSAGAADHLPSASSAWRSGA